MRESYKGLPEIYDTALSFFDRDLSFYEWIDGTTPDFVEGQLCASLVYFHKRKRWYLEDAAYYPDDEPNSTWYARELTHRLPRPEPIGYVKRFFDLAKDESLISLNSKIRPVVLLSKNTDKWWNPSTESGVVESWNCLPLFSYKGRHSQSFVLSDLKLETDRFYMPPFYRTSPGIDKESAALFNSTQSILLGNLKPLRRFDPEKKMSYRYKVSEFALKIITYHNLSNANNLKCFHEHQTQYDDFKEIVASLVNSAFENS